MRDTQIPPQTEQKWISGWGGVGDLYSESFLCRGVLEIQPGSLAQDFRLASENHCSKSAPQMASNKIPYSLPLELGEYPLKCAIICL